MKSSSTLENNFSCPACCETYGDMIFQCENGHLVCDSCSQSLSVCPQCRCSMRNKSRNRALEDLVSLRRRSRGHSSLRSNPPSPSSEEQGNVLGDAQQDVMILFNVKCKKCDITPIKHQRFVCLFCKNTDYCKRCYAKIQEEIKSNKNGNPEKGHVFGLIESLPQNDAFKQMNKYGVRPLFTRGYPEKDFALVCACRDCARPVSQGFVCLHCRQFEILCSTCKQTNLYHHKLKYHIFAVANSSEDLITTKAHFDSCRKGIYFMSLFLQQFLFSIFSGMWNAVVSRDLSFLKRISIKHCIMFIFWLVIILAFANIIFKWSQG